jgi:CcmD family protein
MGPLGYVGAAYACIWLLLLVYAWRLTRTARRLGDRMDAIERRNASTSAR